MSTSTYNGDGELNMKERIDRVQKCIMRILGQLEILVTDIPVLQEEINETIYKQ